MNSDRFMQMILNSFVSELIDELYFSVLLHMWLPMDSALPYHTTDVMVAECGFP